MFTMPFRKLEREQGAFLSKGWTKECTDELRREIGLVAPSHVQIVLIEFRKLRCVSLQCRSLGLLPAPVYS